MSLLSVLLVALGIYFFMKVNFENEIAALSSSILYVATPASWNYLSYLGHFAQNFAYPFLIFYLYFFTLYQKKGKRRFFVISLICYALLLLSHLFVGFVGTLLLVVYALAGIMLYKSSLKRTIGGILKFLTLGVCLVTFWYLPFLRTGWYLPGSYLQEHIVRQTLNIQQLLGISPGLTHLHLAPWLYFFALIGAIFAFQRRSQVSTFLLFSSVISVFYLIAPKIGITFIYLRWFTPIRFIILSSIFLSMLGGFGFGNILAKIDALTGDHIHVRKAAKFISLLLIFLLFIQAGIYMQREERRAGDHTGAYLLSIEISKNFGDKFNRVYISGTLGHIKETFNIVSDTSQPGYFSILNVHRLAYLDGVMYGELGGKEDVRSIVRWFGIKYVIAWTVDNSTWLYEHNGFSEVWSRDYPPSTSEKLFLFRYSNATELVTVSIPSILIIGDTVAYDEVFLSLIPSEHDCESGYIVRGSEYIDDHLIDELSRFDVIMLYGYKYRDQAKAWSLLEQYVNNGGGLIVDTGYSQDINASYIPPPCPVERTSKTDFGLEWQFTYVVSQITKEISLSSFSPAIWNVSGTLYPWGVSASYNGSVRSWATPLLWDEGHPLVVIGEYGKGRVVWSGLNLPYHIVNYNNYWESLFLSKMIHWAMQAPEKKVVTASYTVDRPHPERVIMTIYNQSGGVLFRESYFRNWYAYLIDANGRRQNLQIYRAGPDFMYVSIPRAVEFPVKVVFEYGWTWDEIAGASISVITLAVLTMYTIGSPVDRPIKYVIKKLDETAKRVRDWWYKE